MWSHFQLLGKSLTSLQQLLSFVTGRTSSSSSSSSSSSCTKSRKQITIIVICYRVNPNPNPNPISDARIISLMWPMTIYYWRGKRKLLKTGRAKTLPSFPQILSHTSATSPLQPIPPPSPPLTTTLPAQPYMHKRHYRPIILFNSRCVASPTRC